MILRKPGEKLRTSVVNPTLMDLDDSDDGLEIEPPAPSTAVAASSSASTPVATEGESDDDLVVSRPVAKRRRVSVPEQHDDSDDGGLEFPDSDEDM